MSTLRVLRIYHSGVVRGWRRREDQLRSDGVDATLISSQRWNEGGSPVDLDDDTGRVIGARTLGSHPFLFVYDPRPIWRALRSHCPDIVDIHEEPASLATAQVLVLMALNRRFRPRVCLYSAQNLPKRYPIPFRWFERWALRRADAVHTCNDEVERVLRSKGYSGIIANLGLGVDTATFAPGQMVSDRTGPFRVGYVGRLESHKGVSVLIDAVSGAEGMTLGIVGEGSERTVLEDRVRALGLSDRITFGGHVRQDALGDTYKGFDVLAVPSIETASWVEQFGRVAVEAMASGVPVVSSETGSLAEVLGDCGVLVPQGDIDALRDALEMLRADAVLRDRLRACGLARAGEFSWESVARRHVRLYEDMLR